MTASPRTLGLLAAVIALLIAERLVELGIASRHLRRLRARGAVEFGAAHFPAIVALHTLFPAALVLEVLAGARPPAGWPWLLAPLIAAEALRIASIHELGERWHVRIWVLPGEAPIHTGIYRWLRHPGYLAVALELASLPLMFGAWRTALAGSLLNAGLLAIRIPAENRALRWAGDQAPAAIP